MKVQLTIAILSLLAFGCQKKEEKTLSQSQHPLAKSSILITGGTPNSIKAGILELSSIARKEIPGSALVQIYRQPSGKHLVVFPDGLPPYDLFNLVGWFGFPDGAEGKYTSVGMITSPKTGVRYTVIPEEENEWKDSVIGMSSDGIAVRVCIIHAGMCEISKDVEPIEIESYEGSNLLEEFTIPIDLDQSFGNPGLVFTHPKDTQGLGWAPQ